MSYRQVTLVWAACLVALAAGCRGCAGREETGQEEPDGSPPARIESVSPFTFERGYQVIGQTDDDNRYPSTVELWAEAPPKGGPQYRACSGVLLASNLVLTAAYCLCAPLGGETIHFDASACAARAKIRVIYMPPPVDGVRHGWQADRAGNVLIHPRFQIVIDGLGSVVSSRADLAIVRLERPVSPDVRPVSLATEDVKPGEVLSVVGFGYGEDFGMYGHRRFTREKVQAPVGDDRLHFGSVEVADYKGDTGGPCLRETTRGLELVGISQRGFGKAPALTRIAPYREWLEEQIRLANERP